MQIIALLIASLGAVTLFGGTDDDTGQMRDPRWQTFCDERLPFVNERNAALAGYRRFRAECIAALDNGDRQGAQRLAQQAYDMALRAHECARSIERLARDLLVTPPNGYKNVREATSRAIGKLPRMTLAREAFEKLLANPNLPTAEAAQLLDLIVISPDCPLYGTLTAERVLQGPFRAAEASIATSTEYSYLYAEVLGRRFEDGEASIRLSDRLWRLYSQRHTLPPWSGLNPHACLQCGQRSQVCACGNTLV